MIKRFTRQVRNRLRNRIIVITYDRKIDRRYDRSGIRTSKISMLSPSGGSCLPWLDTALLPLLNTDSTDPPLAALHPLVRVLEQRNKGVLILIERSLKIKR